MGMLVREPISEWPSVYHLYKRMACEIRGNSHFLKQGR